MATRNLNLNATLRLNTKGFQNGLTAAMRSLENFRRDFLSVAGALGASLGISGLVSSLKETATSLNVARATLKNTSATFAEYNSNLEFVDRLSKEYKQDIIGLTDAFAKFHAASQGTNFGLAEQKEIFEGLTRAATFYHMSAERTNNMMIAVEQMMSKGKVTAEELRRQLGNNLPGAYAKVYAAAKRMGEENKNALYSSIKTFGDFETAMKKGQIGVDVLLEFVRDLNKETERIDLSSLQLQLNDLKNAWTELVDSADFEKLLANVYKAAAGVLRYITSNLKSIETTIISIAIGAIAGKLIPAIINIGKAIKGLTLGTWVGMAATAMATLVQVTVQASNKLREVERTMKRISGIEDKQQKLYELQKTYKEYSDYVQENSSKYGGKNRQEYQNSLKPATSWPQVPGVDTRNSLSEKSRDYFNKLEALPEIRKQIDEIQKELDPNGTMHPDRSDMAITVPDVTGGGSGGSGGGKGKKDKTVADILAEYTSDVQKLKNQLKEGSKTTAEAKDELDKLSIKAWENITEFDNLREVLNALPDDAKEAAQGLEDAFVSAKANAANKEAEKAAKEIADKWKDYNQGKADRASDFSARSTRFDYKKSSSDILREEADQWEKVAQDLKKDQEYLVKNFDKLGSTAKSELDKVNSALAEASKHVTNLRDAADVAEWKAEIEELQKELDKGIGNAFKDVAQDLNSVIKGAEKLKDVMEDSDASGWDKIYAVLNEIIKTYEVIISLMESFNTLQEISKALSAAKGAQELSALASTEAAQAAVNAQKGAEIGLTQAATVAEGADAAAALATTAAKSGEAIAGATASGAKVPFPLNLVAIAAGVAAVIAALASIGKFANGGIIKGNSKFGDNSLARVNDGEMILNSTQQARLWNMVNGKSSAVGTGGGKVEFEIKGDRLVGVLKNHSIVKRG